MTPLLSQNPAIDRGLFETVNYIEAGLWLVVAVAFAGYAITHVESRRQAIVAAVTFLLFGTTDVIEVQTGAWWRPWWLFCLKALCVLSMLVLLIRYWRRPIELRRPQPNASNHDSMQPLRDDQPDIDEDIACIECDYNLRGLNATGRCPECGTDIAATFTAKTRFSLRGEHILAGALVVYVCTLFWSLRSLRYITLVAGVSASNWLGIFIPIGLALLGIALLFVGPPLRFRNLLGFLGAYSVVGFLYILVCNAAVASV